jgi:hypothetical protein
LARLSGRQVDDEIELGRLLDRDVAGLRPVKKLIDQLGGTPIQVREVYHSDMLTNVVHLGKCAASAKVVMATRRVKTRDSFTTQSACA